MTPPDTERTGLAQPYKDKVAAGLLLAMLDLLEQAPAGASVAFGGAVMRKADGWTPERIRSSKAAMQKILDAPTLPDQVWHERVVRT